MCICARLSSLEDTDVVGTSSDILWWWQCFVANRNGEIGVDVLRVDDWRWRMTNDYLHWCWWWLMIVVMIVMQTAVGGLVCKFVHRANFNGQQQAQTPVAGYIWNSPSFLWSKVVFSSLVFGCFWSQLPSLFVVSKQKPIFLPLTKSLKRNSCNTDIFHPWCLFRDKPERFRFATRPEVRRFVKFLDLLYDRRRRLVIQCAEPLEELFQDIRQEVGQIVVCGVMGIKLAFFIVLMDHDNWRQNQKVFKMSLGQKTSIVTYNTYNIVLFL